MRYRSRFVHSILLCMCSCETGIPVEPSFGNLHQHGTFFTLTGKQTHKQMYGGMREAQPNLPVRWGWWGPQLQGGPTILDPSSHACKG